MIKDMALYLPPILTIVGWWVVNGSSNKRELRKEKRAEIDSLTKAVLDVLSKARTYYTQSVAEEGSVKIGRELVFEVHRISSRLERLEKDNSKYKVTAAAESLFEEVTGGDFESNDRLPVSHKSEKIYALEFCCHKVIDDLEQGFHESFKKTSWHKWLMGKG